VGFFFGRSTLDDAVAELVLEVARVFDVAAQPEGNSLGLAGGEGLGLRVEKGPERRVDRGRELGTARGQGLDEVALRRPRCSAAQPVASTRKDSRATTCAESTQSRAIASVPTLGAVPYAPWSSAR